MNPRLQRHVSMVATIVAASAIGGFVFSLSQGEVTPRGLLVGTLHGVLISLSLSVLEIWLAVGPARNWIGGLSFTVSLLCRSTIYFAVILIVHRAFMATGFGADRAPEPDALQRAIIFSGIFAVAINFGIEIANLLGARTLMNFVTGRYHEPIEERRFVLFVDIVGSTGLAESLGGLGIHRLLDLTFRLLAESVIDFRGEILGYVGDELIVTWPERDGAINARPLKCFLAMRAALERGSARFEREFGAAPRIRGSLNFGTVIVGEIGDIKRAIVFNGDVMNTAARLEELSRTVDGGFLAARAAIQRFDKSAPVGLRDLGTFEIRGREDAIDVMGLA